MVKKKASARQNAQNRIEEQRGTGLVDLLPVVSVRAVRGEQRDWDERCLPQQQPW